MVRGSGNLDVVKEVHTGFALGVPVNFSSGLEQKTIDYLDIKLD
jgi:hypothetical protein